jgi:large conductance mechanosensitive channel
VDVQPEIRKVGKVIKGFKDFIARGNVVDLSVGVIIGAAFTSVVNAVVTDLLNPLIAGIFGQPDFSKMLILKLGSGDGAPQIMFGSLITAVINFLIVAVAIYFFIVVPINKLKELGTKPDDAEADEAAEPPSPEVELLTEIRDLLKNE